MNKLHLGRRACISFLKQNQVFFDNAPSNQELASITFDHLENKMGEKPLKRPKGKKKSAAFIIRCYERGFTRYDANTSVTSKTYKSFFKTREWQALRYKALKRYGAKCTACGVTPNQGAIMHVDHIKPRSRYPNLALEIENLQILCEQCNMGKSNKDYTDWR